MKMQKSLYSASLAALLLCFSSITISAGHSKSQTAAPDGWPRQLDKRKLYTYECGFVYAGSKSSAGKINKIFKTVVKELKECGIEKATKGLVLVMDKKEKPPFEVEDLMAKHAKEEDKQKGGQESEKGLDSFLEDKKKLEELGIDMNFLLSIAPIPIEPNMLPELVSGFPENLDRQIDWCMIVPTERNMLNGMKKLIDAALKKEKIGTAARVAMFPLLVVAERKAVSGLKKNQQVAFFELLKSRAEKSDNN